METDDDDDAGIELDFEIEPQVAEPADADPVETDQQLEAPEVPEFVQALMDAGLISDDLHAAEIAATAGPTYELDELDMVTIDHLCACLDSAGAQWVIDRAGTLVVHRNDERRADAVFVELFGPEEEVEDDSPDTRQLRGEVEALAAQVVAPPVDPVEKKRWWRR
ncbi:MAG: hypothetical protein P8N02_11195 [Actinomycetota bacterium]|nr:hypothetical protein [Actinomycetota bacterium]